MKDSAPDRSRDEPTVKPPSQTIRPVGIPSEEAVGEPTIWKTFSFAPMWFGDALREAAASGGADGRRREIVFAVCAAESYIVEWVRDDILDRDFGRLSTYFPPGSTEPVAEKWKRVCGEAAAKGLVPAAPSFAGQVWNDFTRLVRLRNGLIHARSSRPETAGVPDKELPYPSKSDLDSMKAGWPTKTVAGLIRSLHAASGTPCPVWVVSPP